MPEVATEEARGFTVPFSEKLLDMLDNAARTCAKQWPDSDSPAGACRTVSVGVKNGLIEIMQLRDIVNRLPKTADNAPATPGMKVYVKENEMPRSCMGQDWFVGNDLRYATSTPENDMIGIDKCYSTQDEAEAAMEAPNGSSRETASKA